MKGHEYSVCYKSYYTPFETDLMHLSIIANIWVDALKYVHVSRTNRKLETPE